MDRLEVAQVLENFVEDRGGPWDWDSYITGVRFDDPYLRNVQLRMSGLPNEFPPTVKGITAAPRDLS